MDGLNFHSLLDFTRNPRLWKDGWYEANRKETPAMVFGTQAHEMLLQGEETFLRNNAVWNPPVNPKTGTEYGAGTKAYLDAKSVWCAENEGKRPCSAETEDALRAMRDEVRRNPAMREILREHDAKGVNSEVMFYGEILDGMKLKGAIDRYDEEVGIVDLKTTAQLSEEFWKYEIYRRKYVEQLAFYQIAVHDVCGSEEWIPCYIAAIETGGQFVSDVRLLDEEMMVRARAEVYGMIAEFRTAQIEDVYAGPHDEVGKITYYPVRMRG